LWLLSTSSSGQNGQEASILHGDDAVGDVKNAIIVYHEQNTRSSLTSQSLPASNKRRRAFEKSVSGL
jgi:hypothetical protein